MNRFKILIVDDNKNNLFTLHTLLNKINNCEIIEATSGHEALSKVLSEDINLIFLDIQMPEIDGFEVAKLLKSKEATKDIPIIFLTAVFKAEEFVKRGYEIGGVDYLTKPIDDNLLLNRTKLYLKLLEREFILKQTLKELKEKEEFIIKQSRFVAMGEMISAIAHQWRQPLNVVGIIIQKIQMAFKRGKIDNINLDKSVSKIMSQLNYMSNTIDDFRNFFKPDKTKEFFNIRKLILEVFNIISTEFEDNHIDIDLYCNCNIENKDKCEVDLYGYPFEFKQVLLNIINNAKDSIIEKKSISNKNYRAKIDVEITPTKNSYFIVIKDNGIGFKNGVIDRVFEPYFSTKKLSGTGVGLYMSKVIIEEHMDGKISVQALDNGAKFIIELNKPKNLRD